MSLLQQAFENEIRSRAKDQADWALKPSKTKGRKYANKFTDDLWHGYLIGVSVVLELEEKKKKKQSKKRV